MTSVLSHPNLVGERTATRRRYLMCRPEHFAVDYAINPWMDPTVPVDRGRALRQWETLRGVYLDLGHRVDELSPLPGLPDMVYAANGGTVINGHAVVARFAHAERAGEAVAYAEWMAAAGYRPVRTEHVNEGQGDLLLLRTAGK